MRKASWGLPSVAALALVVAACTPAAATQAPSGTAFTPSAAPALSAAPASAAPTATLAASLNSSPTAPQKPPAPTNFNVTDQKGNLPCPSPDSDSNCHTADLTWQSAAAPGTWFRIYEAWTGEGGATCVDAQVNESAVITTKADAKSAQLFDMIATGGGGRCLWITAVNQVGESAQTPAEGQ